MFMRILTRLTLLTFLFFKVELSAAQTFPTGFSYSDVSSGWVDPVGTTFNATGTKLFVWERAGKVYLCNWNSLTQQYDKQATAVLNIAPEVGNWRDHGMLGFALDPNFDVNGLIYCFYVVDRHYLMNFGIPGGTYNANTNNYNSATIGRITRYGTTTTGGNLVAVAGTRTILVGETKKTGIPILYESHGVGALAFAADGTLLATTGDAASFISADVGSAAETYYIQALADTIIQANENIGVFRSQLLSSLDGKLLRIDPSTGNGVSSNPFYNAGSPRSAQSRLWAFGLRNPFRMSVRPNTGSTNPSTGDIGEVYVSDVGLSTYEELNIVKNAASNCGWPIFEGITASPDFAPLTVYSDEPNPLYGISGCTQQFFTFGNLIKQATADNSNIIYNPCNPTVQIASVNKDRFFHRYPSIDWKHYVDSARVGVFSGNNLTVQKIGTAASGVTGVSYNGNAAVAGCWYTGTSFPPQYHNTYFAADYANNWIRNFKIEYTDQVKEVSVFETGFPSIIHMSCNPLDGSIFCVDLDSKTIKKVVYGGNQAPVVIMSSDKIYGPGPLSVNFTGNTSYDPDGPSVTYSWNFGDGSALSTTPNPSHNFTSGNSAPKKFVVKLTVKDNLNVTSTDSLIISINNTPPNVTITSPVNNSFYQLGPDTAYSLQANVIDLEHRSYEMTYAWQIILRHNTHHHPEPIDTNRLTTEIISRIGCNGDSYYWFIKLTVTDAAGLSKVDSVKILPQCGGPLPLSLVSFSVSSHGGSNLLNWVTSNELNLKNFEIERSYDGANFVKIGAVNARMTPGDNNYNFRDDNSLDGYIYYRLRIVDLDGKFSNSFIVRVFSGSNTSNDLTISPNPFKNDFLLGAVFTQAGKITIRLIDAKGAVVKVIKKQVNLGFNSFQIDGLENISKGIYFLEVTQDNNTRKTKLIKEK